jgi:hypothetical protein
MILPGMQNRTCGPYLADTNIILISLVARRTAHLVHAEAHPAAVLLELAAGVILVGCADEALHAHVGRRAGGAHVKRAGRIPIGCAVASHVHL